MNQSTEISDLQSAQTFFKKMGCMHMHMHREYPDLYDQYRSLGISDEHEKQWMKEYRKELIQKISDNPNQVPLISRFISALPLPEAAASVDELIDIYDEKNEVIDSFSKILLAEYLIRLMEKHSFEPERHARIKQLATTLLEKAISNPNDIDGEEVKSLGILKIIGVEPEFEIESYVIKRANNSLQKIR